MAQSVPMSGTDQGPPGREGILLGLALWERPDPVPFLLSPYPTPFLRFISKGAFAGQLEQGGWGGGS